MLLNQHRGALIADFHRYYRGSPESLWRGGVPLLDLGAMAVNLPPDSAVARAVDPDWRWTHEAQLLAEVADVLRLLWWAKTKDGEKNINRPAPIPRPGVTPDATGVDTAVIGAWEGFESIEAAHDWYESRFPGRLSASPEHHSHTQPRNERGRFVQR